MSVAPAHGKGEEGSLYEAESWAAIGAFLFGPDPAKALTPHLTSNSNGKSSTKVGCRLHLGACLGGNSQVFTSAHLFDGIMYVTFST